MAGGEGRPADRGGASREQMRALLAAPKTLVIVQHPDSISLTDDEGRIVVLKPDGNKEKQTFEGATVERKTRWDGRSLVTEVKLDGGMKVTQTYVKAAEGLQLIVTTRAEGGPMGRTVELKRVYDQALDSVR
jgi:flagellar hook assembly protein FlgD